MRLEQWIVGTAQNRGVDLAAQWRQIGLGDLFWNGSVDPSLFDEGHKQGTGPRENGHPRSALEEQSLVCASGNCAIGPQDSDGALAMDAKRSLYAGVDHAKHGNTCDCAGGLKCGQRVCRGGVAGNYNGLNILLVNVGQRSGTCVLKTPIMSSRYPPESEAP